MHVVRVVQYASNMICINLSLDTCGVENAKSGPRHYTSIVHIWDLHYDRVGKCCVKPGEWNWIYYMAILNTS